jgi:hypothetical protein
MSRRGFDAAVWIWFKLSPGATGMTYRHNSDRQHSYADGICPSFLMVRRENHGSGV